MFLSKGVNSDEEKKLRMFYSRAYYTMGEFPEEAFGKGIRFFEKEPDKAYSGRTITMDPSAWKDMVAAKQRLVSYAASLLPEDDPVYIEFGVRTGTSMRTVSSSLKGKNATLSALDTFTDLPDGWIPLWGNRVGGELSRLRNVGDMAVANMPTIDDKRGLLIKDLFQDTLPTAIPNLGREGDYSSTSMVVHTRQLSMACLCSTHT